MSGTEIVGGPRLPYKHGARITDAMCSAVDCEGGDRVERDGEGCHSGCCSDYRCLVCGDRFRIEWPD